MTGCGSGYGCFRIHTLSESASEYTDSALAQDQWYHLAEAYKCSAGGTQVESDFILIVLSTGALLPVGNGFF